ncbi:MAG: M28 family peptidase [Ignavibacteria bacterium]|nr:M28 family peptidase [Ignavibacteria bacterium]
MDMVFGIARDLGISQFIDEEGTEITDDHLPLNMIGIRTINLIDFSYPDASNKYWHTLADTPDKCSAQSLAAVGQVLLTVIYSKATTIQ